MPDDDIGAVVRAWRQANGLSVRELAKAVNIHHGQLSRIESNQRRLSVNVAAVMDRVLSTGGRLGEHVNAACSGPSSLSAADDCPPLEPFNGGERLGDGSAAGGALIRAGASASSDERLVGDPDMLPPPPVPFVGRERVHAAVDHVLGTASQRPIAGVIWISGPGGIGKTGSALAAAHRVRREFCGALFADFRGWDECAETRPVESVLRSWCRALGAGPTDLGADDDALVETWHRLASKRRLLVVADNVLPLSLCSLIPARGDTLVIVTSRSRLVTADGAIPVHLGPLAEAEATRLLTDRTGWSERTVRPLIRPCGGWPLALVVAARSVRHWHPEEVPVMATNIAAADEIGPVDRATRRSYTALAPEDQRTWRWCALLHGVVSDGLAAAALNEPGSEVRRRLHRLTDACLLERTSGGFDFFDSHREFAVREAARVDDSTTRESAVWRGLVWYLHGMAGAAPHLAGRDDTPQRLPDLPDEVRPPEIEGYDAAIAWTEAHWSYPAPVRTALAHGWRRLAWQLLAAGISAAYIINPLTTWDQAAADILADPGDGALDDEGRAWCHHARGVSAGAAGDADRALRHLLTALDLRRGLSGDHRRDIGWSALNAARWALVCGRDERQITELLDEGLAAHEAISWTAGIALGAALRGALAQRRGDLAAAINHFETALAQPLADPAITIWASTALASVLLSGPQPDHARAAELAHNAERDATLAGLAWGRISALIVIAETADTPEDRLTALTTAAELAADIADPREAEIRQSI